MKRGPAGDHPSGDQVALVDVAAQVCLIGIPPRECWLVVAVLADPVVYERSSGRPLRVRRCGPHADLDSGPAALASMVTT